MIQTDVLGKLISAPSIVSLTSTLRVRRCVVADAVPPAARPALIAALALRSGEPLLVVVPRQNHADDLAYAIAQLLPEFPVISWQAPETLPYDIFTQDRSLAADRTWFLAQLRNATSGVFIVPARGLTQLLPRPATVDARSLTLKVGRELRPMLLLEFLTESGYAAAPLVQHPASFSRRGGIIDFWPPGSEAAIRVEFFGDEIEAIRRFDPATQRTTDRLETITVLPISDVPISTYRLAAAKLRELDTRSLRPEVLAEWTRLLDRLERGELVPPPEFVLPFLLSDAATILDYHAPDRPVVILDPGAVQLALEQFERQAEEFRDTSELSGELPRGLPRPYHASALILRALADRPVLWLGATSEPSGCSAESSDLGGECAGWADAADAGAHFAGAAGGGPGDCGVFEQSGHDG